jgi:hypothetical protein
VEINLTMLNIPRYIALTTNTELDRDMLRCWLHCVREYGPKGITVSVPTVDNDGVPRTVSLIHRETKRGKHRYLIALARDLAETETRTIVDRFSEQNPNVDFDIETSAVSFSLKDPAISVEAGSYHALCMGVAKRRHDNWVDERSGQGWRYGTTFNAKAKTHPLLRPWDQLPDEYRKPDTDMPQAVIDLLRDQGYAVVSQEDLARWGNMMRVMGL